MHEVGLAEDAGLFADRLEHWPKVARRLADDFQDLGGRGLALERLLGLVEQSDVLDRDHRLVGEGFHEADLVRGERHRLALPERDRSDRGAFAQERCDQQRSLSHRTEPIARGRKLVASLG